MLMIVLLAVAGLLKLALILVTLPLLVELSGLTFASALPGQPSSRRGPLTAVDRLRIVVPCHNEAICITRCIESLAVASGSAASVVVVAHNCSDATAELARQSGACVQVLDDPSRTGKGHALKFGLDYAFSEGQADAVLIVDADSTVSENIAAIVKQRLASAPVLQCRYEVLNYAASWRTRLVSLAFVGMNVIRPRGRDRLGLSCGIFGNGFAIRKDVLDIVPYAAHSVVEDMEFHLRLVEQGYRVRFVEEAFVLADMPLSSTATANQHARWEGGRVRLLSDWGGVLFRGVLRGKSFFVEPLIDLLSLPLGIEVILLLILLVLPGIGTQIYAGFAFAIILIHLGVIVRNSPDPGGSLQALARAPIYLFWRLSMIPSIVRASRSGAAWIRTHRDSSSR